MVLRDLSPDSISSGTLRHGFVTPPIVAVGPVIFVAGLRPIARPLDRFGKTIFIDRLDEDR